MAEYTSYMGAGATQRKRSGESSAVQLPPAAHATDPVRRRRTPQTERTHPEGPVAGGGGFSVGGLLRDGYDRFIRPIEYVNPNNILKIIKTGISIPDKTSALNRVEKLKHDILEDIEMFNHPTNFEYAIADYIVFKYIYYPTQKDFSDRNKGDLLLCQEKNRSLEVENKRLKEDVTRLQQEKTLFTGQQREVVRRNVDYIKEHKTLVENLADKDREIASLQQKLKQQELDIQKERKINGRRAQQINQLRRDNIAHPDSSVSSLMADYENALSENETLIERYSNVSNENEDLKQQQTVLKTENERLKSQKDKKSDERRAVIEEKERLQFENNTLLRHADTADAKVRNDRNLHEGRRKELKKVVEEKTRIQKQAEQKSVERKEKNSRERKDRSIQRHEFAQALAIKRNKKIQLEKKQNRNALSRWRRKLFRVNSTPVIKTPTRLLKYFPNNLSLKKHNVTPVSSSSPPEE